MLFAPLTLALAVASTSMIEALPSGGDPVFHAAPPHIDPWPQPEAPAEPLFGFTPRSDLRVSSAYGRRADPLRRGSEVHRGIDLPAPAGTPVAAAAGGIVRRAGPAGGYGNLVEIDHGDGLATRYGHLERVLVRPGGRVARGSAIGLVGSTGRSTGAHLHYEVRLDGRQVDPAQSLPDPVARPSLRLTPPGALARWDAWADDAAAARLPAPAIPARRASAQPPAAASPSVSDTAAR